MRLQSEWAHLGSNQGPLACEASALPLSYAPCEAKVRGTGEGSLGLLPPGSDPVRNLTAPRARASVPGRGRYFDLSMQALIASSSTFEIFAGGAPAYGDGLPWKSTTPFSTSAVVFALFFAAAALALASSL